MIMRLGNVYVRIVTSYTGGAEKEGKITDKEFLRGNF